MGTDVVVHAVGACKNVHLTIANLAITHNFLPLPLGSANVILEVTWWETLEKIMSFY